MTIISCAGVAGMAQWWECSPPTNVSRVRFPEPASYVGCVCCWFSSWLREVFLRILRFSRLLKNQHPISNSIWIIVKHCIISLWLGWSCKHSLCLTLNLHLHLQVLLGHESSWDFVKACTYCVLKVAEDASTAPILNNANYHSMQFFAPFHWPRTHHGTCK